MSLMRIIEKLLMLMPSFPFVGSIIQRISAGSYLGGTIILCFVYKAFSSTIPMTSPP